MPKNKVYHGPSVARAKFARRRRVGNAFAAGNLHAQAAARRLTLNSLGQNAYLPENAIKGGASTISLQARPARFLGSPF